MSPPEGLAEAQTNAAAQGRWLVVEVTARWAPPQVSLSLTADQVAEFGLLVRADLEAEASFLNQHDVASVPAVLVLLPGGKVYVTRGCITFEQLRDWFVGIRANPNGVAAIDWNSAGRLEALTRLMSGGRAEHLLPELIALWSAPDILTIHEKYLSLVPLITLACAASPLVRSQFAVVRDASKPADDVLKGWTDWLALNDALSEPEVTLAWFDDCVARGVRHGSWSRLEKRILQRGRPEDYLRLFPDPAGQLTSMLEDREYVGDEETDAWLRDGTRREVALLVTAAEAVNAGDKQLRQLVLARDSSSEMRAWLDRPFDDLRLEELSED